MAEPALQVEGVGHRYGRAVALDGLSLTVAAGEVFGLLGPNGAGKTTLMSALAGLLAPTAGSVRVNGRPVSPHDPAGRRRVGLVPQDLALYADLTARENLHFFGRLHGLRGPDLARRAAAVLEAVGLADRAGDRTGTYSGGMKRRLNLGVALLHDPAVLLLDEPTTGVDPQSRRHIFAEVRRRAAAGAAVVYTSHYMEEVQELCTRVGIIDHGRLVACAELPELLKRLPGRLTLRLPRPADLAPLVADLPGAALTADGPDWHLDCPDVTPALVKLLPRLAERGLEPLAVRTQEPNLERVFLHLTGHGLRD